MIIVNIDKPSMKKPSPQQKTA